MTRIAEPFVLPAIAAMFATGIGFVVNYAGAKNWRQGMVGLVSATACFWLALTAFLNYAKR
jgi:hypothetical protein